MLDILRRLLRASTTIVKQVEVALEVGDAQLSDALPDIRYSIASLRALEGAVAAAEASEVLSELRKRHLDTDKVLLSPDHACTLLLQTLRPLIIRLLPPC